MGYDSSGQHNAFCVGGVLSQARQSGDALAPSRLQSTRRICEESKADFARTGDRTPRGTVAELRKIDLDHEGGWLRLHAAHDHASRDADQCRHTAHGSLPSVCRSMGS